MLNPIMITFLTGKAIPIKPTVDRLFPTVTTRVVPLEANFGDHPAKPFKFDIGVMPGIIEW
jgi:hypothetical protein